MWRLWLPAGLAAWCAVSLLLGLWLGPRLKRIAEQETREPNRMESES